VKGFSQIPGIDDKETFKLVACLESVRAILHIEAKHDWEIDQLDVKTAFLHGDLEEEIYMEQPEGMTEPGKEDWVYKLNKTLYSLKQASWQWFKKLHDSMVKEGYKCTSAAHSIYTHTSNLGTSMVATHVNDMLATASTTGEMAQLKLDLWKYFISRSRTSTLAPWYEY